MTDAIIEAAARALQDNLISISPLRDPPTWNGIARAVLAAVTPLIRADVLANEREEIAGQARRYAGHYQEGSDGRNTFIMLAEWIEARS